MQPGDLSETSSSPALAWSAIATAIARLSLGSIHAAV